MTRSDEQTFEAIEITVFTKSGGPLTKQISLAAEGTLRSDGSACTMSSGTAKRARFSSLSAFADYISELGSNQAIALGALHQDRPDEVGVVTKAALAERRVVNRIARTSEHILYRPGQTALVLIDIDTKGMPAAITTQIESLGGLWPTLVSVFPDLAVVGRVVRLSTSAGLHRIDTGERLNGSDGRHIYIRLTDGADAKRFLLCLHERCWLHSLGWYTIGAAGQLLDRSLVDRSVAAAERLVFEADPVLTAPLVQDRGSRTPDVAAGPPLDSRVICPDLRLNERAKLNKLRACAARDRGQDIRAARDKYVEQLAQRLGSSTDEALHLVECQTNGILLPAIPLQFDDPALAEMTVGDVLADPARFVGATLADPVEGISYGRCKAQIIQQSSGALLINSFAHGRTVYELKWDAAAIDVALGKAPKSEVGALFTRLSLDADLTLEAKEVLRDLVHRLTGTGKKIISGNQRAAEKARSREQAQEERDHRAAERTDQRPQIAAPELDAPWLPQMAALNDVLGTSPALEPPMRDVEGFIVEIRRRRLSNMHRLTAVGSNRADCGETRLPAPEEPLLTRLDGAQVAELIERHIDYHDGGGRSVHLPIAFVDHYRQRSDHALPVVTAVATLPIVLENGTVLSAAGLDRDRGIVFQVSDAMRSLLPKVEDCTPSAVAQAMDFLTDAFLSDVPTNYAGKCVLAALALTLIERAVLPERPAFVVSAGQRSTGKTTAVNMISMAVLGRSAAASAWSFSDEERRKSLFAYLAQGPALLVWDNIPRGSTVSCASIEKALTAESYQDRVLGVSEIRTVPATTVQVFTGNNIGPRGDLASRSLIARLTVDRPDPENRIFRHPNPMAWIEANRGRILKALYTILLGNPRLGEKNPGQAGTRFKIWHHLVGAAIEHAAAEHAKDAGILGGVDDTCTPVEISFRELFLAGEADEEETDALVTVLEAFRAQWPNGCKAKEVAEYVGRAETSSIDFKAALEQAAGKQLKIVTATRINWFMKAIVDKPVQTTAGTMVLRSMPSHQGAEFVVENPRSASP